MNKNSINHNQHLPDWQQGEHSISFYLDRIEKMEEWLKQNKNSILQTSLPESQEPEEIVGFVDL